MSSLGQQKGGCGHVMGNFDQHSYCARGRERNTGKNPCVENKDTSTCKFCLVLIPAWSETATRTKESSDIVDLANMSIIGVVGQPETDYPLAPSSVPPENKLKKDKLPSKAKKSSDSPTDTKIAELESQWSERFN